MESSTINRSRNGDHIRPETSIRGQTPKMESSTMNRSRNGDRIRPELSIRQTPNGDHIRPELSIRGQTPNKSKDRSRGAEDANAGGDGLAGESNKWAVMIHPTTRSAFRSQFAMYEADGFITAEQLHTIMGNMTEIRDMEGDYHQPGLILSGAAAALRSDKKLTHNDCLKRIGKTIGQQRKKMEEYQRDDSASRTVNVRWLGTKAYISQLFKCTKQPPNVLFRWQGVPSVNPKLSLLLIVVLMCSVLALSIVGLLTWVNVSVVEHLADESQDVDLLAFSELTKTLVPKIRQSYLQQVEATARNMATPLKYSFDELARGLNELQGFSALQLTTFVKSVDTTVTATMLSALEADCKFFYRTFRQLDMSSMGLSASLERWYTKTKGGGANGTYAVLVELQSMRTTPLYQPAQWDAGNCSTCALQLKCVQDLMVSTREVGMGLQGLENITALETIAASTTVDTWSSSNLTVTEGLTYGMKFSATYGVCFIQSLRQRITTVQRKAKMMINDVQNNTEGKFTEELVIGGLGVGAPTTLNVSTNDGVEAVMLVAGNQYPIPLTNNLYSPTQVTTVVNSATNATSVTVAATTGSTLHHLSPMMLEALQAVGHPSGATTWEMNNATGVIPVGIDLQGNRATGAYSAVALDNNNIVYVVLIHKNREFFVNHLPMRLPKTLPHSSGATIKVSVAAKLGGEAVVLGEERQRSQSSCPHVTLGLAGYSGALDAQSATLEDIVAGYATLEGYDAAIILELPLTYCHTNNVLLPILERAVQEANTRYTSDRRVSVVGRDNVTGALVYLAPSTLKDDPAPLEALKCFSNSPKENQIFHPENDNPEYIEIGSNLKCLYFRNPNVAVLASREVEVVRNKLLAFAGYGICVGAAFALISLIITRLLTRNVLDHIERDYVEYKMQIEEEKRQFSELVKDVMPQYISARIMNGEKLIVDNYPQLTFLFSDIIGFTDRTRSMSTVQMVRLLGYTFMMEDGVAEYYGVHKIKTIGDGYFSVAGLEDSNFANANQASTTYTASEDEVKDREAEKKEGDDGDENGDGEAKVHKGSAGNNGVPSKMNDQIFRMVSFAVVVQQLLSGSYVHFPERTECFFQSAGVDLGQLKLLRMKMGIHSGPAIAGVVDVGRAPHFDCFGPSVNIASRMETTAPSDRIQLSGVTANLLNSKVENQGVFEFEAPKKTLVKGYGTMTTFILKATTLQVPEEIIERLFIERAVKRQYFGEGGLRLGGEMDDQDDHSSVMSDLSGSGHQVNRKRRGDRSRRGDSKSASDKSGSDTEHSPGGDGGIRTLTYPQEESITNAPMASGSTLPIPIAPLPPLGAPPRQGGPPPPMVQPPPAAGGGSLGILGVGPPMPGAGPGMAPPGLPPLGMLPSLGPPPPGA